MTVVTDIGAKLLPEMALDHGRGSTTFDVPGSPMKRSIATLVLCTSLVSATAQPGFQFGPKFIPTAAWFLNADDEGQATSRSAFGFGANYHFKDGTGVGIDLIWSKETQQLDRNGVLWEHELSFLKLPLLLHFNSGSDDVVPFLGYVGVEYVQLQSAHIEVNGQDADELAFIDVNGVQISTMQPEDLFRTTNVGAVLGFGPGWNINENLQFTAIVRADYLFHDPEEKDVAFYWGDRPKTTLLTLGLDLGLKLIIGSGGG